MKNVIDSCAVMEQNNMHTDYSQAVKAIKNAILQSRYNAAKSVNKEILALYYDVGKYVSLNTRNKAWGANAIGKIASQLKQEITGLRGFSDGNIKKMRIFYEEWSFLDLNFRALSTHESLSTENEHIINRASIMHDFDDNDFQTFLAVPFTHQYEIIKKTTNLDERLYYIRHCASEFWTVDKLQYHLAEKLYEREKTNLNNNFSQTIDNSMLRNKALQAFKDEYLLDFVNIEDSDEEPDERVVEHEIVQNIKKFIMAFGCDFAFMGNQYRLEVDGQEFFIDLLFYNRKLQCLVAIELKKGLFKPEYAGKLNFYLSALDEYVKMPNENPSIGIILCKSQSKKIVEFAFRDTNKPMGVSTYKLGKELPSELQNALPKAEDLAKLL